MSRDRVRRRWIFPLALEPIALEPNELQLRERERERPVAALEVVEERLAVHGSAAAVRPSPAGGSFRRLREAAARRAVRRAHRRARRVALDRAAWILSRAYELPDSLRFDLAFLRGPGREAVCRRDPRALACAWTRQFEYGPDAGRTRARDALRFEPLARAFLALLDEQESRVGLPPAPTCADARLVPPVGESFLHPFADTESEARARSEIRPPSTPHPPERSRR